ncbi:hypothetical protein [Streptomyces sp. NPDC058330]|uniref:hypothetical protein n=1 Tax=Streptomyces sp. NPDC058330 TaxID=3346449 RepID=UPI0036DFED23
MTRKYCIHRQTERKAIWFADTRSSQTKIMQNTRRALQSHRNDSTKVARIIVPVFLPPGEDPADVVANAGGRTTVLPAAVQGTSYRVRTQWSEGEAMVPIGQHFVEDLGGLGSVDSRCRAGASP